MGAEQARSRASSAIGLTPAELIGNIRQGLIAPFVSHGEGIAMKMLAALLLTAAIGLVFAAGSYADCGPGHKTAKITAPSTPAPGTTKTG